MRLRQRVARVHQRQLILVLGLSLQYTGSSTSVQPALDLRHRFNISLQVSTVYSVFTVIATQQCTRREEKKRRPYVGIGRPHDISLLIGG